MLIRRLKLLGLLVLAGGAVFAAVVWFQDAPLREAASLLDSGDAAAAMKLISAWEKDYGPHGRSQALRARCFVASGRYGEAIGIFETVGPQTTAEMRDWARAYLHLEQWAQALPLLTAVHDRDPDDADVLHELAACYAKLGMYDEALKYAREFAKHKEYAHRAWLLIGVLQKQRGNKQEAAAAWERVREFDPDYKDLQVSAEEFLTQFAGLEIELGKTSEAEAMIEDALSRKETAEAEYLAGRVDELEGREEEAVRHWTRAIELDPQHLNARESLASAAIASGDGAAAEEYLSPLLGSGELRSTTGYLMQRAAQLTGDDELAGRWRQRTNELRHKEDIDAAVSQLLKENPNSYWARVIRIYQFAERNNWDQAQTLMRQFPQTADEHQFVTELRAAVEKRGTLPSTSLMPIQLF